MTDAIESALCKGKAIILVVSRQVGKTTQQQEIDWREEEQGKLTAFEFRWNARAKARFPATFQQAYPGTAMNVVSPGNYMAFLLPN